MLISPTNVTVFLRITKFKCLLHYFIDSADIRGYNGKILRASCLCIPQEQYDVSSVNKETLLKRLFSDPKNYPYGFSRSGDFSIAESKALNEYGCLIAALVDGQLAPQDDEDRQFLASALGEAEPQSVAERAWVRYQKRINRPKTGSIYGTKKVSVARGDEEALMDVDDDLDIDIDD